MPKQWPHGEQLIERQLSMKDVPPGKSVLAFKVAWRDDLCANDLTADPRSRPLEHCDDGVEQCVARGSPIPGSERSRSVVHVNRCDMRAMGRKAVVEQLRDRQLEPGTLGELAVLCMVERTFDVVEIWSDLDSAGQ